MGKLKALFSKVGNKYNNLSDNQVIHVKTISWIVGVIAAIWLSLLMFVHFPDFMVALIALLFVGFVCWAIYTFVFMMIKTSPW
jgi:hypothetical protein